MLTNCDWFVYEPFALDAGKFFWFVLFMLLTFDYFTHVGIMCANVSSNLQIATTLVLTLVPTWNVLSGFYVPKTVSRALYTTPFTQQAPSSFETLL